MAVGGALSYAMARGKIPHWDLTGSPDLLAKFAVRDFPQADVHVSQ